MVLRIYPKVGYIELEEEMDDGPEILMAQSIMQTQKQEPSPFTNKMIMRESDTSHLRDNNPSHSKESGHSSKSAPNSTHIDLFFSPCFKLKSQKLNS